MKEELIQFKTAKLAKEKGFNIPTFNVYNVNGKLFEFEVPVNGSFKDSLLEDHEIVYDDWNNNNKESCSTPTQSLLQRWLREKHNIHIWITRFLISETEYTFNIENYEGLRQDHTEYKSYEQALEVGLYEALQLIK